MPVTQYHGYETRQLNELFSTAAWRGLAPPERVDACQEVENRLAAAHGTLPRQVAAMPLEGGISGYQQGDWIVINRHLLADGTYRVHDKQGNVAGELHVEGSNWEVLDTLYHEDTHGLQEDMGMAQSRRSYISCEQCPELYRLQQDERQAFDAGQQRTMETIAQVEADQGVQDAGGAPYALRVKEDSYEAALAQAREKFQDPHIEQTLAQVIHDRENGIAPRYPDPAYQKVLSAGYGHTQQQAAAKAGEPAINWQDGTEMARDVQQPSAVRAERDNDAHKGYGIG